MGDSKLYSAQDIEKLKQKIATYKDTLSTLKMGNSVDDYLAMKNEANGFKTKVSKLEGVMEVMNEKQSVQLEEYEQQIRSLSVQMDSLNQTIEELNQDLSLVKDKLKKDERNDVIENVIAPIDVQSSITISNNTEEKVKDPKEETPTISSMRNANLPPSFKELQSLAAKASDIQGVTSDATPIVNIDSHKEYSEEQYFTKQSFPYTGIHPSQIYNGLYRNVNRPSTIHLTNAVKNQAILTNVNENLEASLLQMTNEPANNKTVTPDSSLLQTTSEPEIIEKVAPDPSLVLPTNEPVNNETVTPDPVEVHNVTPIENPIEMKRQQHKNKESLSLLNIFRKK